MTYRQVLNLHECFIPFDNYIKKDDVIYELFCLIKSI